MLLTKFYTECRKYVENKCKSKGLEMDNNKINFTKAQILSLPLPVKNKIDYYYDSQVKGLGIMIFNSGTRTFFLYKRVNGRPDKIKIGRFPEITVEQARRSAYAMINDITLGVNPKEEKSIQNNGQQFKDLINNYLERHAKLHKKTWENDVYMFNRYIASITNKKVRDISKAMVMDLHASISQKHGLYPANRVLSLLHTVYNKAIEWGYNGINPCNGIKKFKEKSRERFLQNDEMAKFFQALNEEP